MSFEEPKIESPENQPSAEKGKVICGWCRKVLGEFSGEGTSHGICPECKAAVMASANLGAEQTLRKNI